jgi:phosphoglycolate phosphatase-like HAD superfamily hydrolase
VSRPLLESLARHYREAPCVFLDCDGVIFDSNGFKLDAIRNVLADYPAPRVAEMLRFWSENGGMSRYRKLEYFFRDLLGTSDVAEQVRTTALRFGELVRRAYVGVEPIGEALALARDAGSRRCFVVSGADQDELRDIFAEKGIGGLFAEVCGSPVPKLEHVTRILRERGCQAERALFIGDGGSDFELSQTLGLPFVYLDEYSEWERAADVMRDAEAVVRADTWQDLLELLEIRQKQR